MEIHLANRDVDRLMAEIAEPSATAGQGKNREEEQRGAKGREAPDGRDKWDRRERKHSQWRTSWGLQGTRNRG
jgi:hypothetical protein